MKKTYKIISIASAMVIGVGAAALPVYADTAHEYYGTTGFCNICGETINAGNHTNKITNNKGGVVLPKDDEDGIPVLPEITDTEEDNGIPVLPEVFEDDTNNHVSEHEYYGTTGFCDICGETINAGNHTNKITNNKDGIVLGKDEEDGIPVLPEAEVKTITIDGKTADIICYSGTYKEVFNYIDNLGYKDYTVKDQWGTTVQRYYNISPSGKCSVIFPTDPQPEAKIYTRTLVIDGKETVIKCTSGTYKEVFDYIDSLGYKNYKVKDQWGTTVYSWYTVKVDCKCYIA
ncbi:MAG: DUF348 domain-containing protein [Lachnospiraceae bacterium]|nr:DUF348 domain-containing protein [Lachnospiraceae bacterium]